MPQRWSKVRRRKFSGLGQREAQVVGDGISRFAKFHEQILRSRDRRMEFEPDNCSARLLNIQGLHARGEGGWIEAEQLRGPFLAGHDPLRGIKRSHILSRSMASNSLAV